MGEASVRDAAGFGEVALDGAWVVAGTVSGTVDADVGVVVTAFGDDRSLEAHPTSIKPVTTVDATSVRQLLIPHPPRELCPASLDTRGSALAAARRARALPTP